MRRLLPGWRLVDVAQRILARQPDPPRRVGLRDVIEIHLTTLLYAFVLVPALVVIYIRVRAPLPPSVTAQFVGVTILAMALLMTRMLLGLRNSLRNGVAATAEILDASRSAGHLRVEINGHVVDSTYRSSPFERLATGDRVIVLVDPRKESVLLTLGRTNQRLTL
jgi:hypothetical protein